MADLVPGARGMYGRRHSTVLLSKAVRRIKTINEHPKLREILAEAVSSAGGISIFMDDLERQFGTVKGIMDAYVQETDDPFLRESKPFRQTSDSALPSGLFTSGSALPSSFPSS